MIRFVNQGNESFPISNSNFFGSLTLFYRLVLLTKFPQQVAG